MEARRTLPPELPETTLGYEVAAWMEAWLRSPADPADPLRLTDEQARFLAHWYAVGPDGRWVYRRGVLRRPKGWGKDPLCACICWAELLGPVRFDGLDAHGDPVGRPPEWPSVLVGAVSETQTRTTTDLLAPTASDALIDAYSVDISERRVYAEVGGRKARLRPVTASARSAEGGRPTAFISNETQHWLSSNGGHAMSSVIRRNLAKAPDGAARELSITNAHEPGEESVAELDDEAWAEQQRAGGGDILLDTVEPLLPDGFDMADDGQLAAAIAIPYGGSYWVDIDRVVADVRDPQQSPAHAQRFYMNLLVAGADRWLGPSEVDAAYADLGVPPAESSISIGFDGSWSHDSTAVVATTMDGAWQWCAGLWEKDEADPAWRVDKAEVNAVIAALFDRYRVSRLYADPAFWSRDTAEWEGRWPEQVAEFWMTGARALKAARAYMAYRAAIRQREVSFGGPFSDAFRRHLLNAVEKPYQVHVDAGELHTIRKQSRHSTRRIDIAVAATLSWQARLDAIADGWRPPVKFRARRPTAAQ